MTKIKICGLKRKEDIEYVNELKPEYIGLVFAKSSRQVTISQARDITTKLDKNIKKVGVFLNMSKEKVSYIAQCCGLNILQFHGEETPDYCNSFGQEVWKAFRIKDMNSFNGIKEYSVDGYLLDAYNVEQYGGSGKTFPWKLGKDLETSKPIILAGGLNSCNVGTAIEMIKPDIVDVSSGVEENGLKDFEKIKHFIENVRR